MCLYPKLIWNRKYQRNKKNGGNVPIATDERILKVPVGCGKCMECKKQKARGWSIRLQEEIRTKTNGKFVTLTISNKSIGELIGDLPKIEGYKLDNEIATLAVRRFLERWRKKYKVSIRHWLVTELGGNGTENIHLHGIIWTDETRDTVADIWKYGYIWPRPENGWRKNYVSNRTVNYCVKYTTKTDKMHPNYNAIILTSPGIGKDYTKRMDAKLNKYQPGKTKETYTTRTGTKMNLATYWRNQIYTEEQREKLWIEKLDKQERWVDGIKIDTSTDKGVEEYYNVLMEARAKNKRLGYGDDEKDWSKIAYETERRKINMKKRLEKFVRDYQID